MSRHSSFDLPKVGKKGARVGIISDTHGWLDPHFEAVFSDCDFIVHAGDIGDPSVLRGLEEIAPTYAIRGNIDGGELRFEPLIRLLSVHGRKLALLHIAGNPRRPTKAARQLVDEMEPDVLIVGHSHIPLVGKYKGALWVNPGAAGRQGFHAERTAMRMWIPRDGEVELEAVHLGPRGRAASRKGTPDEG